MVNCVLSSIVGMFIAGCLLVALAIVTYVNRCIKHIHQTLTEVKVEVTVVKRMVV